MQDGRQVTAGPGTGALSPVTDVEERLRGGSGDTSGVEVLEWPALAGLGIDAAVTTRAGGVSGGPYRSLNLGLHVGDDPASVVENRRRAAAAIGAALDDLVFAVQVHGTRAAVVGAADRGRGARAQGTALAGADALVTAEPGAVLVTLVADCAPVLIADPDAGVLSTVHAGWRGTAAGVVAAALSRAAGLGADPSRMVAWIGPTVAASGYEVGEEVARAMRDRLGEQAQEVLAEGRPGHWLLDIPAALRLQLLDGGIPSSLIRTSPWTTADGRFYSDRRARPCGRFALLARLRR